MAHVLGRLHVVGPVARAQAPGHEVLLPLSASLGRLRRNRGGQHLNTDVWAADSKSLRVLSTTL
eukprot:2348816-Alexandrium_andersonii.AAC.1